MDTLLEMKEQLQVLKTKLNEQEIINDQLLRHVTQQRMRRINRNIRQLCVPLYALLVVLRGGNNPLYATLFPCHTATASLGKRGGHQHGRPADGSQAGEASAQVVQRLVLRGHTAGGAVADMVWCRVVFCFQPRFVHAPHHYHRCPRRRYYRWYHRTPNEQTHHPRDGRPDR